MRTYRDVFLNTHHLLVEAEQIHKLKREENLVALYKVTKKYGHTNPDDVLNALHESYLSRMHKYAVNSRLVPPGETQAERKASFFQHHVLNAAIERASLQNWTNATQLKEIKAFVDEILEKS